MTHKSPWFRFDGWPVLGAPEANANPGALWSHRGASELIVSVDDDERENPPIKLRIRVNKTESTIDVTIGK